MLTDELHCSLSMPMLYETAGIGDVIAIMMGAEIECVTVNERQINAQTVAGRPGGLEDIRVGIQ